MMWRPPQAPWRFMTGCTRFIIKLTRAFRGLTGSAGNMRLRWTSFPNTFRAERYIAKHILPLFPETMKKTERKKAIRAKLREAFKSERGYPCWAQSADWPLGKDGLPATYLGKGKSEGDLRRWRFRDESTGELLVVEQYL